MDNLQQELRDKAIRQSDKAVKMWCESKLIFESDRRDITSVQSAIELNCRAIDECRAAINIFRFLRGLRH